MEPALIDTDILSFFFRNHPQVRSNFHRYLTEYGSIRLSIITYYEIVSGLNHRDAHNQLSSFLEFASRNIILPLTERSVTISADLYAQLRNAGTPIDDIDLLIAGTALEHKLTLVTHNVNHFGRIEALDIQDWSVD